jgi:diguanylate cyclase (GGDEF)-like protein/PAS domain S-box-containing protein
VLGPAATALVGRPLLDVVHPDDRSGLAAVLGVAPEAGTGPTGVPVTGLFVVRLRDHEGVWRWFEAGITDLRTDPDVAAVVLHCRDMTERHAREQALLGVAYTDPVTGLPNRAGFLSALGEELESTPDPGATLLLVELDGLTEARQQLGRDAVTHLVTEIGRRLRSTVRGEDTVARMGGGDFAVLTHGTPGEADRLAARCLSVVEQPVVTDEGVVDLTAAIGMTGVDPADAGGSVEALLHRAELAVRAAHEAAPGTARRYDAALGGAADRQARLRAALEQACANEELVLLFAPIMAIEHHRITGLEAQLRWRHRDLGDVPPAEFLPMAERTGLIGELMRWALREATTITAGLPVRDGLPLRVGLPVPHGYAATGMLVPDVEAALQASGLAPERLVLRIGSATVASADDRTGLDVATLRLMGVHVALAGFGSGNSALADLTRHPIDIVTLDRSFIARIDRDRRTRALCESVIGIGRALGLDVVAEGVDTPAQLAALAAAGCGFAQGFHIARPVSAAGLVASVSGGTADWPGLVGSR